MRDPTERRLLVVRLRPEPWQTVPYDRYPSVGLFEGDHFDPRDVEAADADDARTSSMRADDAFWAARRVMAFTDDLIRAAVHTGQFSDPAAERHLGGGAHQAPRRDRAALSDRPSTRSSIRASTPTGR